MVSLLALQTHPMNTMLQHIPIRIFAILWAAFAQYACQPTISDEVLQDRIEEALQSHPEIRIQVQDQVVTLTGTVTSDDQRREAENAAKANNHKFIRTIDNHIAVTATPQDIDSADAALQVRAEALVADFPNIEIVVGAGIVTVTGTVRQSQKKELQNALNKLGAKGLNIDRLAISIN